jgi:hypothetical protein
LYAYIPRYTNSQRTTKRRIYLMRTDRIIRRGRAKPLAKALEVLETEYRRGYEEGFRAAIRAVTDTPAATKEQHDILPPANNKQTGGDDADASAEAEGDSHPG